MTVSFSMPPMPPGELTLKKSPPGRGMRAPLGEILKDLYHNGTAQWWERQKGEALIPPLERNYTVLVQMLMLG